MRTIEPEKLYTEAEAAQALGVSRSTLQFLRRTGELAHIAWLRRSVRYRGSALIAYIKSCERRALVRTPMRRARRGSGGSDVA